MSKKNPLYICLEESRVTQACIKTLRINFDNVKQDTAMKFQLQTVTE